MDVCQVAAIADAETRDCRLNDGQSCKIVNSTQPESSPPTTDSIVSMRNWEDRVCRLLIIVDDCPQDVLKINSRNPEAIDIQHGADEIYTGRMVAQTECWLALVRYGGLFGY